MIADSAFLSGAGQILLSSLDVMAASYPLGNMPAVLPTVLSRSTLIRTLQTSADMGISSR